MIPMPADSPYAATFGEALVVLVQEEHGPLEDAIRFTRSLGGAETNVAIGLASHGIPTAAITQVGDDGFGRYIQSALAALGVDISAIGVDAIHTTGLYVKEVGGDTGRTFDLGPGRSKMHYYRAASAGAHLAPSHLDHPAVAAVLDRARLIHTTGITPALSRSASDAQKALVTRMAGRSLIAFDVNWRPRLWTDREDTGRELLREFFQHSDIAIAGLDETDAVFGMTDPDRIRRAFPHPRWLVLKNGGGAVTAFDRDDRVDVPAHIGVTVVEAIGAGDAFASGFLAGILERRPLDECVRQGHDTAVRALSSSADYIRPDRFVTATTEGLR